MKSKHKPLPSNAYPKQSPPISVQTTNKRHSQQHNPKNHFPISSTQFLIPEQNQQGIYSSALKNYPGNNPLRSSPYRHLPSLESQSKSFQLNSSKMSENQYVYSRNNQSIYDQITGTSGRRSYDIEQYENGNNRENISQQVKNYDTRRKSSTNDVNQYQSYTQKSPSIPQKNFNKRQHQPMQYYMGQNSHGDSQLMRSRKSQQVIKREINDKLDRVCEKIQNMSVSREKDNKQKCHNHRNDSIKQNMYYQANNSSTPKIYQNTSGQPTPKASQKLCYSSIVYQPSTELSRTISSVITNFPLQQQLSRRALQERNDNKIHHRILSPSKPSLIEIQETRIIQLEKKVTLQGCRILKLEEELLGERQKLIRKEKQWLLRENQLLNWIEENQKELEQYKLEFIESTQAEPVRQNVVIQNKSGRKPIKYSDYSASKSNKKSNIAQNSSIKNKKLPTPNKNTIVDTNFMELFNNVLKMVKLNQNWMGLMNRTLSEELPGTAFRVKEEMNLNLNFLKEVQNQCTMRFSKIKSEQKNNPFLQRQNISQPFQFPLDNQSDVFLLESYCPPTSQRYEISTKRNHSNIKPQSSRKSLCISESKSTTNKKNLNSTHKKNTKSKNNLQQKRWSQDLKVKESLNRSICDQVFYENGPVVAQKNIRKIISSNCQVDFYYLMSLQAMALEEFIVLPTKSTDEETYEEDLLCNDSQLLESES